jgi:hypothetical protein
MGSTFGAIGQSPTRNALVSEIRRDCRLQCQELPPTGDQVALFRPRLGRLERTCINETVLMPLDLLLAVVRDPEAPRPERLQSAAIAAPYCHLKLTAQVTAYLDATKLSDSELLDSIANLERQIAAMSSEPPTTPDNPAPGSVVRPAAAEWHQPLPLLRRPGDLPPPAPAESQHLRYDPVARKMVSVVQ